MIEAALWTGGSLLLGYPLAALHWLGYRSWKKATATVVRFEEDPTPSADQGGLRAPVLRFRPADGDWIEVVDPVFSKSKLRVGQEVRVVYPPSAPSQARLAANRYVVQLLAGTIGLLIFLVGIFGSD